MKAKKALILFLTLCVAFSAVFCLGVAAEDAADNANKGLSTGAIVSLCIAGALIIAAVVICVIKREKVKESLKAYKSEMKKITWYPKKQVWASTLFVIVSVIAIAAVIGLLDYAFFQGQNLLVNLFR